ncbi:MAG: hypothetical protein JO299_00875 [Gammaproteobacteria bacterium]|nr:hypothetical protein [Gammaproteobacteria bacterium]
MAADSCAHRLQRRGNMPLSSRARRIFSPLLITLTVSYSAIAAASNLQVCPVGCSYSSIQSAIDAASSGDTIDIGKGRYLEHLTVIGKRLTLQGADARTTVIDANGKGTVVTIGNNVGASTAVSLSDLTITNNDALDWGGGIFGTAQSATFRLTNSTVSANTTGGAGGGVALSCDVSQLTLSNSSIVGNTAQTGGGVFIGAGIPNSQVNIQNVLIGTNHATATAAGSPWPVGVHRANGFHA